MTLAQKLGRYTGEMYKRANVDDVNSRLLALRDMIANGASKIDSLPPTPLLGAGIGAVGGGLMAPKGRRMEGMGRGMLSGAGAGLGIDVGGIGGLLAGALGGAGVGGLAGYGVGQSNGAQDAPEAFGTAGAVLGGLTGGVAGGVGGAAGGGALGYGAIQGLLGKPSWERDREDFMNMVKHRLREDDDARNNEPLA